MSNRVAVWKQARKERGSARKFFRKHERLLTFVGAIIVFATFVMREGVIERLRETSSAVREAEAEYDNYVLVTNTSTLAGWPGEIIEKLTRLDENRYDEEKDELKAVKTMAEDVLEVRPFLRRSLMLWNDDLDEMAVLSGILSDAKTRTDKRRKLRTELEDATKSFDRIPRLSVAEFRAKRGTEQVTDGEMIVREYQSFNTSREKEALDQIFEFQQLSEEVDRKKAKAEWWYKHSTVASYLLYSLGWGLGLVGKVYGIGGAYGE